MFILRRTAVRAISATPSNGLLTKSRSITSVTPAAFRLRQQPSWSIASFQRRFNSDESFSQTAAEAPVEEDLTPATRNNAYASSSIDALEEAAKPMRDSPRRSGRNDRDDTPVEPGKMLYIGNLFFQVTPDQVKRVFSKFGEVVSVRLIYDNRGLSRGFGYVEYKSIPEAQAAIDNLDMQVFEGRNLVVQFHREKPFEQRAAARGEVLRRSPLEPTNTLFIGNMSFEMSDKDLNDLFREIRNVLDVRVAIDRRTGQPRGFAHADFVDEPSATRAKEILSEKTVYGRQLRVDYSESTNHRRHMNGPARSDSQQES